ncbi:hypothetical protein [uncultured Bacteroides sp.]|nr:hypothetical protein [uncultured Bacteroides sp.]
MDSSQAGEISAVSKRNSCGKQKKFQSQVRETAVADRNGSSLKQERFFS